MRIVIIGYGFLASQISYQLNKKNIKNIILTTKKNIKNKNIYYFNYRNLSSLTKLIKKDDCIIYTSGPDQEDCKKNFNKNKLFIENEFNSFLKICSKKQIKQFIFFSSVHVYGDIKSIKIDESTKTKPINNYSKIKLLYELQIVGNDLNNNFKSKILRISNVFGPTYNIKQNYFDLLIPNFIKNAYVENKIQINSKYPYLQKDFIDINSFFIILLKILKTNYHKNTFILNVGSYEPITLVSLAKKIKLIFSDLYQRKIIINKNDNFKKFNFKFESSYLKNDSNRMAKNFDKTLKETVIFIVNKYD